MGQRRGAGRNAREIEERQLMVNQLTSAGESARQIAVRIGISSRQVVRYRNGRVTCYRGLRLSEYEVERRRKIVLARYGRATLDEMAAEMGRSAPTVSKVVADLRHEGLIGCCHFAGCPNQRGGDCEFAR